MSEKFTIARSLRQHVANNALYEIVRAGWSRTASIKHELRTHGEQRSTLFERGSVCSSRLTSTLPHSPVSLSHCLSVSLCAVWMKAGWRVYSATLESADLVQTLPTPYYVCRACSMFTDQSASMPPHYLAVIPMRVQRRVFNVSPSYRMNRRRDNASGETARPSNVRRSTKSAAAEYPACAISHRMPGHGARPPRPDGRVPMLLSHVMSTVCLPHV